MIDLGIPSKIIDWYGNAYENVTDVVENELLCNKMYFAVYLVWMNFIVKFIIPTAILVVCNVKILLEVMYIFIFIFSINLEVNSSNSMKYSNPSILATSILATLANWRFYLFSKLLGPFTTYI